MKFHLISDLHTDSWQLRAELKNKQGDNFLLDLYPTGDETLIIAGDLCEYRYLQRHGIEMFRDLCNKYRHVIYVAGNHEYYGTNYQVFQERFKYLQKEFDNLHCLENETVEINDISIAGTTLWFRDTPENILYERHLNDFRYIEDFKNWVYDVNQRAQDFLKELSNPDLIILHHLPSHQSVNAKYTNEPTNLYFLCDINNIISDLNPKFVVHGHTHIGCEYNINNTRVICNPRGYPGENENQYNVREFEL